MEAIQIFLFVIILIALVKGLLYFKKLIKLQEENNSLLRKLCDRNQTKNNKDSKNAMPTEDLEKLKASYIANMNIDKYVK